MVPSAGGVGFGPQGVQDKGASGALVGFPFLTQTWFHVCSPCVVLLDRPLCLCYLFHSGRRWGGPDTRGR